MDLSLKSITIKNFRSIEYAQLDLSKTGMVLINGKSGHGKTNIFLAIAYVLGFCPLPSTKLQSWNSKDPMSVELTILINGKDFWIHRGTDYVGCADAAPMNEGKIGGALYGAKNVNSRLEYALGLTPEMLSILVYRPQRELGSFIKKTDAEKKEFLSKILGLDVFEKAIETSSGVIKDLELKISIKNSELVLIKQSIDELSNGMGQPVDGDINLIKNQLNNLKEQVIKVKDNVKGLDFVINQKKDQAERIKAANKLINELISKCEIEKTEIAKQRHKNKQSLLIEQLSLQEKDRESKKILERITYFENQLNKINEGICPTCESEIINKAAENKIINELNILKSKFDPINNEDKIKISDIQISLQEIDNSPLPEPKTKISLELAYSNLHQIQQEGIGSENLLIQYESEEKRLVAEGNGLLNQLNILDNVQKRYEQDLRNLQNKKQSLNTLQAAIDDLNTKLEAELLFTKIVGNKGFLGGIFEEVLEEIASTANGILSKAPNTASVSVWFTTEQQTQKGTSKRSISLITSVSGNEDNFESILSGGMQTVVALAIDLAVAKVIARRSNIQTNWLMLDEAFDGCDAESRTNILELLATENKLWMVVDHAQESADLFSMRVEVENDAGISKVSTNF